MSSEISPELVTLVLGNNLWNIGKKLLQVCPKTLSRRKKTKAIEKLFALHQNRIITAALKTSGAVKIPFAECNHLPVYQRINWSKSHWYRTYEWVIFPQSQMQEMKEMKETVQFLNFQALRSGTCWRAALKSGAYFNVRRIIQRIFQNFRHFLYLDNNIYHYGI